MKLTGQDLKVDNILLNRQTWVDSLRGFAIILMLVGHSAIGDNSKHLIYGFHMPLFWVISGYLFHLKNEDKMDGLIL